MITKHISKLAGLIGSILLAGMMSVANADTFQEPPDGFKHVSPAIVGVVTIAFDGDSGSNLTFNGRCGSNDGVSIPIQNTLSKGVTPDQFTRNHLVGYYLQDSAALAEGQGCSPNIPPNSTIGINSLTINSAGGVKHISSDLATSHVVIFFTQ